MTTNTLDTALAGPLRLHTPRGLLRLVTEYFLWLPIGGLAALLWANLAPESYFAVTHRLAFPVNQIGMALFFALIAQEIIEAVLPGGMLHTWRRWLFPIVGAAGAAGGGAMVYLAYVQWKYELLLWEGWPVAVAIDLAFVYVLVRALFGRHPALPFALVVAVCANAAGAALLAAREPVIDPRPEHATLLAAALGIAWIMRLSRVTSVWAYLAVCGPIAWWALYRTGINPALSLVPIVPFLQHTARAGVLFEERPHSAHDSPRHLEHVLKYPIHVALFLFGLVNAGVLIRGYGTGTWAVLLASLVGKPLGLLGGVALATAIGLHWPKGLRWRDLVVVSLATSGGFATALFIATAVYPTGPALGELKLGVIGSGVGVLGALAAARWGRVRTRRAPRHHRHAHGHGRA
jgi:NhaA family Na+:H+ antiporter